VENTFLMIKPDGVQRGLVGEIVKRFEQKGFQLAAAKLFQMNRQQAELHYQEHQGKDFYERLVNIITSGPVFAMVWQGDDVIALSRLMIGKTSALDAAPGTIRGDYAIHTHLNLIHGSDSPDSAKREISNFFGPEELVAYEKALHSWI
jgi:nucleoside-diphosphate kinase